MAFAGPGTVAVVSGASSGIGRRIVVELAAAGATVIGVARREALLVALADELGPNVRYRTCDVSDVDAYVAAVRSLEQEHGRIDVLVNAAARTEPVDAGLAGYRTVMETNFFAPLAAMLEVLPGMRTRRHGAIVNVSSDDGRAPGPGPGDYPASKAALTALTESLWFAARTDGVALHVLYPAFVPTPMGMGSVDRGEMALPPRASRMPRRSRRPCSPASTRAPARSSSPELRCALRHLEREGATKFSHLREPPRQPRREPPRSAGRGPLEASSAR